VCLAARGITISIKQSKEELMPTTRFRLTGSQQSADDVVTALHSLDDVDRIEEVLDQMNEMRDDSSSNGLVDDSGPGLHCIEVEGPARISDTVIGLVEAKAHDLGLVVEFVKRF